MREFFTLVKINKLFSVIGRFGVLLVGSIICLSPAYALDYGDHHAIQIMKDGFVKTWGLNASGQLGNGTKVNSSAPTTVLIGSNQPLTGIINVGAGANSSFAVDVNGDIWAWGRQSSASGQLGLPGVIEDQVYAQKVSTSHIFPPSPVIAIEGANGYTIALRADGRLLKWGREPFQAKIDRPQLWSELRNIIEIESMTLHTLALRADGIAFSWGGAPFGRLGNGAPCPTRNDCPRVETPAPIIKIDGTNLTNIKSLAAGENFGMALLTNGEVWSWGAGYAGTQGAPAADKAQKIYDLTNVIKIESSAFSVFILHADGTVKAWGHNTNGEIGNGTLNIDLLVPTTVQWQDGTILKDLENIIDIDAGRDFTVLVHADGSLFSAGRNDFGELGNGSMGTDQAYFRKIGLRNARTDVDSHKTASRGTAVRMAGHTGGRLNAWGCNNLASNCFLGAKLSGDYVTSPTANGVLRRGTQTMYPRFISSTFDTVAAMTDGSFWKWGNNSDNDFGLPTRIVSTPLEDTSISNVIATASGFGYTVLLKADGTVWGLGWNDIGQLSQGTSDSSLYLSPIQLMMSSGVPVTNIKSIAAGRGHTLMLAGDGTILSTGWNDFGQLGVNINSNRYFPTRVSGPESGVLTNVKSIHAGLYQSFAVLGDGKAYAWGHNGYGVLGINKSTLINKTPVGMQGIRNALEISTAYYTSYVLLAGGYVKSAGSNQDEMLGNGRESTPNYIVSESAIPVFVFQNSNDFFKGVTDLSNGNYSFSMMVRKHDEIWSWGSNFHAQMGDGTKDSIVEPVPVAADALVN